MKRWLVFAGKDAESPPLGWHAFAGSFDTKGLARRYAIAYVGHDAVRWAQVVDLKMQRVMETY